MTYIQKHPDEKYLREDPFGGDMDVHRAHHKCKMVVTRKEHQCTGSYANEEHTIPAGTKCYFESCLIDGSYGSIYYCLKCFDQYFIDTGQDEDVENEA